MLRNTVYYNLKPFVPRALRTAVRRRLALRRRDLARDIWPIMPGSERPPRGWTGWPDRKKFAVVLTHDVEGKAGLEKCRPLMHLETELEFRSSFNFVPEGSYRVPSTFRQELVQNGFEVGVHDLKHDGRLFRSATEFPRLATRINHYLEDWNAIGFRSGFMLRNLDWLHQLNIEYDMSTFDTDPFEPQPIGNHTIFPFWVRPPASSIHCGSDDSSFHGYVELPYTLPQDSTLFIVLREDSPEIWLRKLDWIAEHGGMVLVNVHPDYLEFEGNRSSSSTYPAAFYKGFLDYLRERYRGEYWQALPRELSQWYRDTARTNLALTDDTDTDSTPSSPNGGRLLGKRTAVLLYSYYPADPRPRRAAEALVEAGMEVDLLCLRREGEAPREVVNGVNVYRVPIGKKRSSKAAYFIQYGRFFLSSFRFLARRRLGARYDLVHVHNMPDLLVFATLLPKVAGAKIILDLHDPMPEVMMSIYGLKSDDWPVSLLRSAERWSIGCADLALTPNIAFKNLFVSRSCDEKKMQIVMNSPQQEIFDPNRVKADSEGAPSNGEFRIMHHGSIAHRHGIDLLVQALARVRSVVPNARLDIYGAPTEFLETIMSLARRLNVLDIVHYHGEKPQTEIAEAIRGCHLGVVPNRRTAFTELNFPTRLFEYLSMRRPVIAPATQGILDYFKADELLTFEPNNVEDLTAKILWVHSRPEEAQQFVDRGIEVYRRHLWRNEKRRFVEHVSGLLEAA